MTETRRLWLISRALRLQPASGTVVHGSAKVGHFSIEDVIGETTPAWDLISLLTRTAQALVQNVL